MKHIARSSVFRRTAALLLAAVLALPTVYAAAGEQKLQTTSTLTDGLTYRNTVTVNNSSRIESFSLELEPDSQVQPIMIQASGTVYGAATINRAVTQAQEKKIRCGNELPMELADGDYRVYSPAGDFLMLGREEKGILKTVKSFFEV